MNPYSNKGNIRTFSKDVDPMELVWHQDKEDRHIEVIEVKEVNTNGQSVTIWLSVREIVYL